MWVLFYSPTLRWHRGSQICIFLPMKLSVYRWKAFSTMARLYRALDRYNAMCLINCMIHFIYIVYIAVGFIARTLSMYSKILILFKSKSSSSSLATEESTMECCLFHQIGFNCLGKQMLAVRQAGPRTWPSLIL